MFVINSCFTVNVILYDFFYSGVGIVRSWNQNMRRLQR